ncbi:hypothetical protein QR680_009172 [Steinernema hermaphroditum]|uniref:Uncharacterized protein n=1 Tax=Steinernema hermaphroditum TaxID=289476 RepID=A0AA39IKL9_9BILA|nr:hypothetical protein QR680_009172 [Steinernema hermaphroditum]
MRPSPLLRASLLLGVLCTLLHASPVAPSEVDSTLVALQKTISELREKLQSIEAALPPKNPFIPAAQNQPDEAAVQAARDLLLGQQRLNTRQIAWQPMRRMVSWQPMKRDNREPVIKAVEEKLSEVLRAAELLGVSAEDVLKDLKLRNALRQ